MDHPAVQRHAQDVRFAADLTILLTRRPLLPVPTDSRSPLERPLTQGFDLEALVDEVNTHYIRLALEKCGGRKTTAAGLLGFSNHQTLGNWMKRLGIASDETA